MTEAHYEYSPFGEIVVQSGDLADSFTHRFSTKPWCAVTGLSEYEKRKYGAGLERWRSRDPIGEQGGKHLYAIGNNEIINQLDYFGLWSLSFKGEWDASEIKKVQVAFTTLRSLIPTYMAGWKSWVSAASQLPDDCEYKNAVQQELTKIYAILSGIRDGLNSSDTINVYKRDYKDAKDASVGMPFDNKPWNFGH